MAHLPGHDAGRDAGQIAERGLEPPRDRGCCTLERRSVPRPRSGVGDGADQAGGHPRGDPRLPPGTGHRARGDADAVGAELGRDGRRSVVVHEHGVHPLYEGCGEVGAHVPS